MNRKMIQKYIVASKQVEIVLPAGSILITSVYVLMCAVVA